MSSEEPAELEARARGYTSPYRDVLRAKIVLLAAAGLSHEVIAAWTCPARWSANGGSASLRNVSPDWRNSRGAGGQPVFPPGVAVQVKALACELPHRYGLPLSGFTLPEIQREVVQQGMVATLSGARLWRWLSQDAIRPWHYRSWIFPRAPHFGEKAAPLLDLYEGIGKGAPFAGH